jgi:hypothetical protein
MKYTDKMGLGVTMYIPSFIKIGLPIKKLVKGDTQTDRHTDLVFKRAGA